MNVLDLFAKKIKYVTSKLENIENQPVLRSVNFKTKNKWLLETFWKYNDKKEWTLKCTKNVKY